MKAAITLLHTLLLPDFPSASAVEYFDGRLYLIGDDATGIRVLDRDYQMIKNIPVMAATGKRIPKTEKPDFEASALITLHGKKYLMASGSLATEKRRKILLLALPEVASAATAGVVGANTDPEERTQAAYKTDAKRPDIFSIVQQLDYPAAFITQLAASGISELNIEGATVIGEALLLSNRGNNAYPVNQLIVTRTAFWENEHAAEISVLPLALLTPTPVFSGVSELCYIPGKDLLLCTLSSEATTNAYDDGAIGDSYIGWITDISQKLSGTSLVLEGWLNLAEAHPIFNTEKIEGICLESSTEDSLILHLVSDNDGGESRLFKVTLSLR